MARSGELYPQATTKAQAVDDAQADVSVKPELRKHSNKVSHWMNDSE